ncbi:MAG: phospholipase D-like domain-containing protein, partial [Myxococcota bacterium]
MAQLQAGKGTVEPATFTVQDHRVCLLHDGAQCYPAMLSAIAAAEREVFMEMYWFGSDRAGWSFAEAMIERARAGVDVRLLYDAIGSIDADGEIFDAMCAAGVRVLQYNPIAPWRRRFRLDRLGRRTHRKILVVDGRVGFTGGVNIGDPWLPVGQGGQGWRDDMVRIVGPAATTLRGVIRHGWRQMEKGEEADEVSPPARLLGPGEGHGVRILANRYYGKARAIRAHFLRRIRGAKRNVYISNSYFLPDRTVRWALARAAKRGVDVRLLIPARSDVAAVHYATRKMFPWLLKRGIAIYAWLPSVLHSKTAMVDGRWCTVGTYNLDYLSWRSN